jgi:surface antigen
VAGRRLPATILVLALGLAMAGCSFSYQLDSLFAKKDTADVETTGSIRPVADHQATSEIPNESDLAHARAAASEVLAKGGKDASLPWENPLTGARGTITPIASVYTQDGMTCRDFLASYVRNGAESWLQGDACRAAPGKWQVRGLRPWKSS